MIDRDGLPIPRDMTIADLDGVVDVQRDCFSPSRSVLSALDKRVIRAYYGQFLQEPESHAVVLVQPHTGRIVGVTCGTWKPGLKKRFLRAHCVMCAWSILAGLLTSRNLWKALCYRMKERNVTRLRQYGSMLAEHGVPAPRGTEDINMAIAVHSEFRGGGNAKRLLEFYTSRVFGMGVARIRGAILSSNAASVKFFRRQSWEFKQVSETEFSVWIDRPTIP